MLELLKRADGESAHYYARRVLLYNIVSLNLKPGDRIREADICSQLNVSRTPVREGILDLVQYRLIELYPQSGTYVSKIDLEYVESARYLRQLLEADVSRQASLMRDPIQLAVLKENLRQQQIIGAQYGKEKEFFLLDMRFHHILYEICNRQMLIDSLDNLCAHLDRARVLSFHGKVSDKILQDHVDIVRAVEQQDGEAAYEAAYRHLGRALEDQPGLRGEYPQYYKSERD